MQTSLLNGGEDTGGLDDVLDAVLGPGNGRGVLLSVHLDGVAVDHEVAVNDVDLALVRAVGGVVLEEVRLDSFQAD